MVGTDIFASCVLSLVDLDQGLGGTVPVVVGIELFGLTKFGVVGDNVLLGQVTLVVLVYLMPVILAHESPVVTR